MIKGFLKKDRSISQKLSFIILLTTSVALIFSFAAFLINDFYLYRREQQKKLAMLTEVLSNNTQASVAFGDVKSAETSLSALQVEKHIVLAAIYTNDGELFAFYKPANSSVEPPANTGLLARISDNGNFQARRPITIDGKWLGTIYLEADRKELASILSYYIGVTLCILCLAMAAAIVVAYKLQQFFTGPILQLTELAKKVSKDRDYSVRMKKHTEDELGLLTENFNLMLSEIQIRENTLQEIAQRLAESNQELAQSNKDLEQFAYIASHDLQEPLRKIIAFSDRLKQEGPGALSEEEKDDFLTRMHNAGHRMKNIVEDLLQFSRVSRHELLYERINLKSVVEEVMSDLEISIAQVGARIVIADLPEISANRSQMHHLFQNLITNSIKFSRKNIPPKISIESSKGKDDMTEIRVRDNGIGFDEKYSEKIFKPFQRLHNKDEYEGTGIGLAIVEKIVLNHGGKISAVSKPNEGATFIILLPMSLPTGTIAA